MVSKSPEETEKAGVEFAKGLKAGDVIGLKGDLGTGKTCFVKGICKYFNTADEVSSPTFLIVNEYSGYDPAKKKNIHINHFDLYRLKSVDELAGIGFDGYIRRDSVCLVEWPDLANKYLHDKIDTVSFEHGNNDNVRIINLPKK